MGRYPCVPAPLCDLATLREYGFLLRCQLCAMPRPTLSRQVAKTQRTAALDWSIRSIDKLRRRYTALTHRRNLRDEFSDWPVNDIRRGGKEEPITAQAYTGFKFRLPKTKLYPVRLADFLDKIQSGEFSYVWSVPKDVRLCARI